MSRRSNLSTLGRQQRAASRMTPGTSMWSEQMFNNPIMRPAVAAEPDTPKNFPPDRFWAWAWDDGGNPTKTITAPPAGMTHGLVMVAAQYAKDVIVPPGWTLLQKWTSHPRMNEWAFLHTTDPNAGLVHGFATEVGRPELAVVWAWFTGGSGGTWQIIEGAHRTYISTDVNPTSPGSPTPEAWLQVVALTGVYTWNDKNGFSCGQGFVVAGVYPANGSAPGAAMSAYTPRPESTLIDWTGIGAYGNPYGQTYALRWKP